MRAFLGVTLSDDARGALAQALKKEPAWPSARRVRARNWHVTLVFLDSIDAEAGAKLRAAMDAASLGARFPLTTGAYGAFPSSAKARVVWLGFRVGVEALMDLQRKVAAAAQAAGFAVERDYHPHLTLARLDPPSDVARAVDGAPPPSVVISVDRVVLFSSTPGAQGSEYSEVASWALA